MGNLPLEFYGGVTVFRTKFQVMNGAQSRGGSRGGSGVHSKISCKPVLPLDLHKVSQNALEVLSGVPYFQNFPGGKAPSVNSNPPPLFKFLDPPLQRT